MPRSAPHSGTSLEAWVDAHPPAPAIAAPCPILGFAAISGTGKTTLLLRLIPLLRTRGLRIGLIKRAHHSFDTDVPGKDSYALRKAGASRVLVGSDHRWALVVENDPPREPTIADMLSGICAGDLDLVLVEGFKSAPIPKIEIHRPRLGHPLLAVDDPYVIAVATDNPEFVMVDRPLLDLNRPEQVAQFIHRWFLAC